MSIRLCVKSAVPCCSVCFRERNEEFHFYCWNNDRSQPQSLALLTELIARRAVLVPAGEVGLGEDGG